jgi:hypothetical protein
MSIFLIWQSSNDIQEPDELYAIYSNEKEAQCYVDTYNLKHKDTQFPYYIE